MNIHVFNKLNAFGEVFCRGILYIPSGLLIIIQSPAQFGGKDIHLAGTQRTHGDTIRSNVHSNVIYTNILTTIYTQIHECYVTIGRSIAEVYGNFLLCGPLWASINRVESAGIGRVSHITNIKCADANSTLIRTSKSNLQVRQILFKLGQDSIDWSRVTRFDEQAVARNSIRC